MYKSGRSPSIPKPFTPSMSAVPTCKIKEILPGSRQSRTGLAERIYRLCSALGTRRMEVLQTKTGCEPSGPVFPYTSLDTVPDLQLAPPPEYLSGSSNKSTPATSCIVRVKCKVSDQQGSTSLGIAETGSWLTPGPDSLRTSVRTCRLKPSNLHSIGVPQGSPGTRSARQPKQDGPLASAWTLRLQWCKTGHCREALPTPRPATLPWPYTLFIETVSSQ